MMAFFTLAMSVAGFCGLCLITEKLDEDTAIALWFCVVVLCLGVCGLCLMGQSQEAERRRKAPGIREEDYPIDEI